MLSQQDGYFTSLILAQMIQSAFPVQLSYTKTIIYVILSFHGDDTQWSLLGWSATSIWKWYPPYQGLSVWWALCLPTIFLQNALMCPSLDHVGSDRQSQMVKCVLCSHTTFTCKALVCPSPDCVGKNGWVWWTIWVCLPFSMLSGLGHNTHHINPW